ncbi:MAG TPA: YggS family pyridoxal phosphate-dependent enzyme [Candidatus Dormibacteraeota bacterium]|nr:YggS family pyridoxal phosphate-dependent enzyme [Candidatus Dormibacteraeota bacterium]
MASSLADNLAKVRQTIADRARRSGRDPEGVTIVAVTKTFPVAVVREAMVLGLHIFGENRVQEAIPKIDEIGTADANWHLIGHLQSNKVKFIEGRFAMVQSIDSAAIAEALGRRLHSPLEVLVEVNIGEEPQKTGARAADLEGIVRSVEQFEQLRLQGLMMIAPMVEDLEDSRPLFQKLRILRDEISKRLGLALPVLSMGMTDDYAIAVEEGATMLRLGRALFGPRPSAEPR